ncbi:hypothetical protein KIN20_025216 [Parelaphostrongylus tenuis]|uniref:Probable arginine--tRNA ligase, mitochondrial n=1 Tax=Parelaphostrongylus tenuis TaxID=148309 RepID=A0AAD5MUU6_PARTN|nr:hypothetical protein KIN20_025216 [Parelaphostrongylus tenuis]
MNAGYLRQLRQSGALKTICSDQINNQQCQKIVIDYSSPNIGKQFHVGNLRSTLIGKYLDKVHRAIGNQVISVNYLGDWGTQFATIAAYWPKMALRIHICARSSLFSFRSDQGTKLHGKRAPVFGPSIYPKRVASILHRDDQFHADRYMYIVDRGQRSHFEALRVILSKIGRDDLAEKIEHVPYGRVKGLSTRMGRTEIVSEIIDRGKELALQFMKESKTIKVPPEKAGEVAHHLSLSTVIFMT